MLKFFLRYIYKDSFLKNIFFLLFITLFFASCSEPTLPEIDFDPKDSVQGKRYKTQECHKEMAIGDDIIAEGRVDEIVIYKSKRKMNLYRNGVLVDTLPVSLGKNPEGHKEKRGDYRTPEGQYWIKRKLCSQKYYRSLCISYPHPNDVKKANAKGVNPGGDITIHAQPTWNATGKGDNYTFSKDWTQGCIAVSNKDMQRLWYAVREGVSITIEK